MWTRLDFLVGTWQGTGAGRPGNSQVERTYQFVLNNQFLEERSTSTYPPQEQNPRGEVHREMGFISYDKARKTFVFRQFHIEGFVNQYVMESPASDEDQTVVFATESIENIPTGWRARETYRRVNSNEFIEVFELAAPGQDFEIYSQSHFKRVV